LLEKCSKTSITIVIPENFRLRRAAALSIDLLIAGRWESAQKLPKTVPFLKIFSCGGLSFNFLNVQDC